MTPRDELQQQLWELHYGLLPEPEAEKLVARICSDPDVAREYAEMKVLTEMLGRSARLEHPEIDWRCAPGVTTEETANSPSTLPSNSAATALLPRVVAEPPIIASKSSSILLGSGKIARSVNWLSGIAASLLVVLNALHTQFGKSDRSEVETAAVARTELDLSSENSGTTQDRWQRRQSPGFPMGRTSRSLASVEEGVPKDERNSDSRPDEFVVTTIVAPPLLERDTTNYVHVTTRSREGRARSVPVRYYWSDESHQIEHTNVVFTDQMGQGQIELPGFQGRFGNLRVESEDKSQPGVATDLFFESARFQVHLTTDKPIYRPGEIVHYRSLVLSRLDLVPADGARVYFEILDGKDSPVPDSQFETKTSNGVASGEFLISSEMPLGKYSLRLRSPDREFVEQDRPIRLMTTRSPMNTLRWSFDRASYSAGDRVGLKMQVRKPDSVVDASATARMQVMQGQREIYSESKSIDRNGEFDVAFSLPNELDKGHIDAIVSVSEQEQVESFSKAVPVRTGSFDLEFFPEGGPFVSGVLNRVYFRAMNSLREPIHVAGDIVDPAGVVIASFSAERHGMGKVSLTPSEGAAYAIRLKEPTNVKFVGKLPAVLGGRLLTIDAGNGVFGPNEPIRLQLRSQFPDWNLLITGQCRGAFAGQVITKMDSAAPAGHAVEFPLAENASGVVRVTVFDMDQRPPRPLAERLIFRPAPRRLSVSLVGKAEKYLNGQSAKLGVHVNDEAGRPTPAALGISVVDQSVLQFDEAPTPNVVTRFFLTAQVRPAQRIENANLLLTDEPGAAGSLDMYLATAGWRSFQDQTSLNQVAARSSGADRGMGMSAMASQNINDPSSLAMPERRFGTEVQSKELPLSYLDNLELVQTPKIVDNRDESASPFVGSPQPDNASASKPNSAYISAPGLGSVTQTSPPATVEQRDRADALAREAQLRGERAATQAMNKVNSSAERPGNPSRILPDKQFGSAWIGPLTLWAGFAIIVVSGIATLSLTERRFVRLGPSWIAGVVCIGLALLATRNTGLGTPPSPNSSPGQTQVASAVYKSTDDTAPMFDSPISKTDAEKKTDADGIDAEALPQSLSKSPKVATRGLGLRRKTGDEVESSKLEETKSNIEIKAAEGSGANPRGDANLLRGLTSEARPAEPTFKRSMSDAPETNRLRANPTLTTAPVPSPSTTRSASPLPAPSPRAPPPPAPARAPAQAPTSEPTSAPAPTTQQNLESLAEPVGEGRIVKKKSGKVTPPGAVGEPSSEEQQRVAEIAESAQHDYYYYRVFPAPVRLGLKARDSTETLLWQPLTITDAQGQAEIEFRLPDRLAGYRILAEAHSPGRLGTVSESIVAESSIELVAKLPQVLTAGDTVELSILAKNQLDVPVETTLKVESFEALPFDVNEPNQLDIPARGRVLVRRNLKALPMEPSVGELAVQLDGAGYEFRMKQQVNIRKSTDLGKPKLNAPSPIDFSVSLENSSGKIGDRVSLNIALENLSGRQLANVEARIPLLAGCEVSIEHLDRLRESRQVHGYFVQEGELTLAWGTVDAASKGDRRIALTIPSVLTHAGMFTAPPATVKVGPNGELFGVASSSLVMTVQGQ